MPAAGSQRSISSRRNHDQRDTGYDRMSHTASTGPVASSATKSASLMVECPALKITIPVYPD
jgi:hypothetical protein